MAIAFDAATQGGAGSTTFSHTVGSGSNRILFVGIDDTSASDNVTGVTYAGVAMTKVRPAATAFSNTMTLWYLVSPASGANNVVVSGSLSTCLPSASSYTGAAQTGIPDASATNNGGPVGSLTTSVTTVADNCWTILMARSSSTNLSAGAGTTQRNGADTYGLYDSNGAITPAGSSSLITTGGSQSMLHVMCSFAPFVASAGRANRITTLGVG